MTYLQKVELDGYRTIRNLSVEFQPGINIIIGKNGVGKSNFLKFLSPVLNTIPVKETSQYTANVTIVKNADLWQVEQANNTIVNADMSPVVTAKNRLLKNGVEVTPAKDRPFGLRDTLIANMLQHLFIRHGIPNRYAPFAEPLSFEVEVRDLEILFPVLDILNETTSFGMALKQLSFKEIMSIPITSPEENMVGIIKDAIYAVANKLINNILPDLTLYAHIENMRMSGSLGVYYSAATRSFKVSNISFEFFVNNQWLNFDALSDGTRRLFYAISEICSQHYVYLPIVLMEEPELSIHPHQLHQLLQFIREESDNKQFIITTHSPQVLDMLEKDELNRIQIARLENGKTTIRQLTEEQIKKAQTYMENEAFLSDYWRFSDLEE